MKVLLLRLLGLFASCGHRQNSVGYVNKKVSLNSGWQRREKLEKGYCGACSVKDRAAPLLGTTLK